MRREDSKKGRKCGAVLLCLFANRNDDPVQLMEAAEWWIKRHQLDHFEKAVKIREMVKADL
ncbi:DUF6500 family protein [Phaeobacter inhibens]|uniref:DUF6500 family protein n=1 Tax=Phaeobacter inhibens TaxID=221822 RepID=UPI0030B93E9B